MEVMEDGNLMDKVNILIQRDMEYYKAKQTILQETICPGIIGGRLDFPRYASFASVKLVLWWEEEYVAAYRKSSGLLPKTTSEENDPDEIVKTSDPDKFATLITKSADQLLEHLHMLTQEALDHADLTVLTGTIGAAALMKNCLWCYIQLINDKNKSEPLQKSHKEYNEMVEALAERLLDLHCRLVSLYILQDADALDWENPQPFFESERGSYIIQMWWTYMQSTKQDLWNTVPPKMAQRVFAGMLNESLTILTVRYTQSRPSASRSKLISVDISNLLFCVAQFLPAICSNAPELLGLGLNNHSKILRDIHAKCQELLICFMLRGAPLDVLYKVFRKGTDNVEIFKSRHSGPSPWVILTLSNFFQQKSSVNLSAETAITTNMSVLLAQPQPNWALLLQVLGMRGGIVMDHILRVAANEYSNSNDRLLLQSKLNACKGFLCAGDGLCNKNESINSFLTDQNYHDLIIAATYVLLEIGNDADLLRIFIPVVENSPNWSHYFDKRQIWNQNKPPWLIAILYLIHPLLESVIERVISAIQTGASMYQAMSIILACFSQFWECHNLVISRLALLFEDILPANVLPIGNSILLQFLMSALYTELLQKAEEQRKTVRFSLEYQNSLSISNSSPTLAKEVSIQRNSVSSFDGSLNSVESIALAVAESLCSMDEDNKHTEQIEEFLEQARENLESQNVPFDGCDRVEEGSFRCEVLASNLLTLKEGKKSLKNLYEFIVCNYEWIFQKLSVSEVKDPIVPNCAIPTAPKLLQTMFYIGHRPFDQFLSGEWEPDWTGLFRTAMGLTMERVYNQISHRWEFRDLNLTDLSTPDAQIVSHITTLLNQ